MAEQANILPQSGGDDDGYTERVSFRVTPNRAPLIGWSAAFLLPCILICISFITNGFTARSIPDVLVILLLIFCAAFTVSYAFSGISAENEKLMFRKVTGKKLSFASKDIKWVRVTRSSFTLCLDDGVKMFLGGCEPGRLEIYLKARGIEVKKDKK